MKSEKIMKVQRVFLAVTIGLIFFASCTKEEAIIPTYDASFYEDELVFDTEDDITVSKIWGQVHSPNGNHISQGGIVYLLNNDNAIDMYVSTDGKYEFTEIEHKKYGLKFDFSGYSTKIIENVFPQTEIINDTLY